MRTASLLVFLLLLAVEVLANSPVVQVALSNRRVCTLPWTEDLTLRGAILRAGGLHGFEPSTIIVDRGTQQHRFRLRAVIEGTQPDFVLKAGDSVFFPPRVTSF